MLHTPKP